VIQEEMKQYDLSMNYWPVSTKQSLTDLGNRGAGITDNLLHINTLNEPFTMKIQELALQGKHNLFNSMAAGVTARLFELRKELVRDSLTNFENIEHRLEFVTKVHGITFINDSKATNINSTWYALESIDKPVIWIAGGVDKGNDYSELFELVEEKVKALICLGTDNEKLKTAFAGRIDTIVEAGSADEAVQLAYDLGFKGDTVLLSPACASFDLFSNYEDRGHQFKAAVRSL
jgi:UDP-N-acetylmuramoylalanine--D-glutamate ligase